MYDREMAKRAVTLAAHSYDSNEDFLAFLKKFDPSYSANFVVDKKTDTQSVVLRTKDKTEAIVVFRGSESEEDWKTDFKADLETVTFLPNKQRLHRGFNSVYEKVRKRIIKLLSKSKKVTVIGHSLGGALATICALDLKTLNPHAEISVWTFGSPRVGDKKFVEYYESFIPAELSFRFVNGEDPVTKIPPPIEYDHVGYEYKIGQSWWRRSLRKYFKIRFMFLDIKDHFMKNYIKHI